MKGTLHEEWGPSISHRELLVPARHVHTASVSTCVSSLQPSVIFHSGPDVIAQNDFLLCRFIFILSFVGAADTETGEN